MPKNICDDYCESTICDGCKYKYATDEDKEDAFVELYKELGIEEVGE